MFEKWGVLNVTAGHSRPINQPKGLSAAIYAAALLQRVARRLRQVRVKLHKRSLVHAAAKDAAVYS